MTSTDEFVIELVRREELVTAAQLEAAEARLNAVIDAGEEPPSLAAMLVDQGATTEAALCAVMSAELDLPVIELAGVRASGETLTLVSHEQALRYGIMPLEQTADSLRIAVSDPLDLSAVDELGHLHHRAIETVLAAPTAIKNAIARHYGSDPDDADGTVTASTEAAGAPSEGAVTEDDAPIIQRVHAIIAEALRQRASDIHLEPLERRFRVRYRIDGRLLEVESPPKRLQLPLISRVKIMADISIAEKRLPQDGRIQVKVDGRSIDLRVSTVPTAHGESIVMRILDAEGLKPGLGEMGLSDDDAAMLKRLIGLADGMVLVTGPTGSGKTTTLYSCLHDINRPDRKIITVEDPVEYQLSGINQVPVRSEVGLTFAAALRAMLRQAPNVVMVGEIRDRETAEIAINASLTGHLVFSTLHTNDAPGAVTRMIDLGLPAFLVAGSLRAVVAQRLVRRVCESCREPVEPDPAGVAMVQAAGMSVAEGRFCRGGGCPACHGTGYRGRLAIFEFFVVNEAIERLIHQHAGLSSLREHARQIGMRTLREDGLRKAAAGQTTLEEVMAATVGDPIFSTT
ncbi:GspE/PulE family protein [Synoicihabitans lomoniglobus]|uniref:ATPase, T2SS/T4P/T4SS family n=1 Tax=Synoicihabitans lomoniglobus TaxID=2909285 RepID=A0AAF0CSC2_9BACT|nr:Flp pilus assembly complex ATPase component TadA [Opitutaceae bacterium LMO-M01]WED67202.1 ATPase, T2SS/T4P/T4SS family [Opitutaceae bacterium LMO-M01]